MVQNNQSPPISGSPAPKNDVGDDLKATILSFERTEVSAERTLMSVLRTSLALVGFGLTVYQVPIWAKSLGLVVIADPMSRRFGLALLILGFMFLALGILSYGMTSRKLTERSRRLNRVDQVSIVPPVHGRTASVLIVLLLFAALAMLGILAVD
jgi:putative membrane protein